MAGKLEGKVAVVTGASSGIGEATALALVVEGAKVAVAARRGDRLEELMLLGSIDGANTEDWRRMVNTNILGLMYATHAVLPILKAQGGGHIVNISSVAGRTARAGSGVYNATKWGVGAFSESLRQEVYKDKIRVTIIEPGAVATELSNHITDTEAKERIEEWVKSMTPLESEDIARAIVYAVSQPPHVNVNEILIRPTEQER